MFFESARHATEDTSQRSGTAVERCIITLHWLPPNAMSCNILCIDCSHAIRTLGIGSAGPAFQLSCPSNCLKVVSGAAQKTHTAGNSRKNLDALSASQRLGFRCAINTRNIAHDSSSGLSPIRRTCADRIETSLTLQSRHQGARHTWFLRLFSTKGIISRNQHPR